jgi:hypothetical protein
MTSYKTNDPKGWMWDPKLGAALGRPTIQGELDEGETISIVRKQLDGDYDENDTYFGGGPDVDPLFWVSSESGGVDYMIRAKGISDALQGITFTVRIVERIVGDVIDKERIYSIVFDREQLLDSVIGFIYAVIRPYIDDHGFTPKEDEVVHLTMDVVNKIRRRLDSLSDDNLDQIRSLGRRGRILSGYRILARAFAS